ncbi:MAG: hypothetical protein LAT81_04350 [Oceanicaulis sp.]|nr:hypothetical protein [Oceanicaulis sp.]
MIETEILALWGAATGTIGTITGALSLWLRYRHLKRDQTKLRCEVRFDYEVTDGVPKPRYKFVVRNVGRRPVTLDRVQYCYHPKAYRDRLFTRWHWRTGNWCSSDEISKFQPVTLSESQKYEFQIMDFRLPGLQSVGRLRVIDQAERSWRVPWPNKKRIERETSFGEVDKHEESNPRRICKLFGYRIKGEYFIYAQWNHEPPSKGAQKGRTLRFENEADFKLKWAEITSSVIPALMAEEVNDIV